MFSNYSGDLLTRGDKKRFSAVSRTGPQIQSNYTRGTLTECGDNNRLQGTGSIEHSGRMYTSGHH